MDDDGVPADASSGAEAIALRDAWRTSAGVADALAQVRRMSLTCCTIKLTATALSAPAKIG